MKKIYLPVLMLMLLFIVSLAADTQAEINEAMGIDTYSHQPLSGQRTSRDIPEGGLLLIPDWSNDRVMAFDPITGDLYDADFIPSDETNLSSPKEAALHPDGNSILVSDQLGDGLIQYDLDGNFMGWFAPAGGVNNSILDNVRGWGLKADGNILVCNDGGTGNPDCIVEFDVSGNCIGNFVASGSGGMQGPFSILYRPTQDDYLVTASGSDALHQYDNAGNYVGDLVAGINFPQQVTETPSGNLLVAGFSTPAGCYEYSSIGTYVGYYSVVGGLRGVYELGNGNILVTDATGVYEIDRNNTIVSTKITGMSAHFIHFVEGSGASVADPPTDVSVDEETGTLFWSAPAGEPIIYDNFDSYTAGNYLAEVGDDWTTWSNAPGGSEDGVISDTYSNSPSNSVEVIENNDIVLIMDDYTTGVYAYEMKMYVPTGYCGYFNLQKTSTPGQEWAFQIYFQTDGTALADAGAAGALTYSFNHDEWMALKVIVDLDNDWATYYHDDVEMIGYQWTLGCFGTPGLLSFGGVNIWGGANSTTTDIPMFYFDDVMLSAAEAPARDITGYNVYLDDMGTILATVGIDVFEYTYDGLIPEQAYTAGVSAVYDDPGESEIIEVPFVYDPEPILDPPVNLAVVSNTADDFATFTWEAPGGGGEIEELIYDNGTSTGAYSYVGYSMGCQMSPSEACQILTLKIHTSDGTDFNAEVWGWDAGAPTEDLYYQENVDAVLEDWVLVDVSGENLMFDGDFVVAFGSLNATTYMSYDAGLNNGRAWDHADAGGWSSWSEAYLVRAIVQYADGRIAEISPTPIKTNNVVNRVLESGERINMDVVDHNVDNLRELTGYNVYLDGVLQGNTTDLLWVFTDLVNGEEYIAGVEAVYDEGISDLVDITFLYEGTIAGDIIVTATQLKGNYPNPFNPTTTISFSLKEAGHVSINIYNMRGQLVKTLVNGELERNYYEIVWDGRDNSGKNTASGVYFYKMKTQNYNSTKKMILMK